MKDVTRQYPLLTPDERFRLFVEAYGRNDDQELDRLENTCPRRHYTGQDCGYSGRKTFFVQLALMTALWRQRTEKLCLLALVVALAEDGDDEERVETSERALEMFKELMRRRQGKRDAWVRFCDEIGVSPDAITKRFLDGSEWVMRPAEAVWETLQADSNEGGANPEATAKQELDPLLDAWRERYMS